MNVYLDTSVILSRLLNQSNQLSTWGEWQACYTSALTRVEFLRTVDRMRLNGELSDRERVELQDQFGVVWAATHHVALTSDLLERASAAMPTVLGTLGALHLATVLELEKSRHIDVCLLTHDTQLATGAMAMGVKVDGVSRAGS